MRPYRFAIPGGVLAVLAPLALAACAGAPVPKAELGAARQAIQGAEQAGAQQYAPVELELARSKIDEAERAVRSDDESEARLLALEARADANYAASKARAESARQAAAVANRGVNPRGAVQSGASVGATGGTGATDWSRPMPQQPSGIQGGTR